MNKYLIFDNATITSSCIKIIELKKSNKNDFEILFWDSNNIYWTYVTSNWNIYTWWKLIKWAEINTFQVFNYAISKDDNNVYEHHLKRDKYDAISFKQVFSKFFQDKTWVYIHHKKLHTFIDEDSDSFEYIGWYYAKDKNYVYNLSPTYWIKISTDPETFEYLGWWFGKDKENYYYRRWSISSIDYNTAKYLGSYYIKDKDNVFCWNNILENAEPESFVYISDNLAKDINSTYDNCKILTTTLIYSESNKETEINSNLTSININDEKNIILNNYCDSKEIFPELNISKNISTNSKYSISSYLDYDNKILKSTQNIYYVNKTDKLLSEIPIILDKNRINNIFCLGEVLINWELFTDYNYNWDEIIINLENRLDINKWVNIQLEFKINIPNNSYDFWTLNHKQLRFADWYPIISAYDNKIDWGFIINNPAANGEYMTYDISNYDVNIEYKSQLPLVFAWPGIEKNIWKNKISFQITNARNFTWLVSPYFHKISKKVWDTIIQSFSFFHHKWESEALLNISTEAYNLFSDIYWVNNQEIISIVEVDFIEAMEYQNIIALWSPFYDHYNSSNRNLFIPIVVHEIAHQWWYWLVGNNQAKTPWLDEWFTMWSEWYFFEKLYPQDYNWWKDFRMNRRNSQVSSSGNITSSIYEFTSYWDYISSTYHKWVYKLEEIRNLIWDDNYFKLLKEYFNNSKYKLADWEYFNNLLEKYQK
jgi:hypothetical protein